MRARPVFECSPYAEDFIMQLRAFREDERAWFEEVVANPNVQEVMKIPADEPIFVVRAQDKHASGVVTHWLLVADGNGGISNEKYNRVGSIRTAIDNWQALNYAKVKQPD